MISFTILVFVSPVGFGFPWRPLLKQSLSLTVLPAANPCYYTGALLMWWGGV